MFLSFQNVHRLELGNKFWVEHITVKSEIRTHIDVQNKKYADSYFPFNW